MIAVKGFEKHLIFYRQRETGIEIVRVLHAARDVEAILCGKGGERGVQGD
jgi:toxin ParE1/3/4